MRGPPHTSPPTPPHTNFTSPFSHACILATLSRYILFLAGGCLSRYYSILFCSKGRLAHSIIGCLDGYADILSTRIYRRSTSIVDGGSVIYFMETDCTVHVLL